MKKKVKDFSQFQMDIICDKYLCHEGCPLYHNDEEKGPIFYCEVYKEIKQNEDEIKQCENKIKSLKELLEREIEVSEEYE